MFIVILDAFNFYSFKEVAACVNLSVAVDFGGGVNVWGKTAGKLHNFNLACL